MTFIKYLSLKIIHRILIDIWKGLTNTEIYRSIYISLVYILLKEQIHQVDFIKPMCPRSFCRYVRFCDGVGSGRMSSLSPDL